MSPRLLSQFSGRGFCPIATAADGSVGADAAARFARPDPDIQWFLVGPGNVELRPDLADLLARFARERPDVGIFYGDDVALAAAGSPDIALKPDWDLALFLAKDYIGFPIFVQPSVAKRLGGLNTSRRTAAVYDFLLRAHLSGVPVARIPDVLALHPGTLPRATLEDRGTAIQASAAQMGTMLEMSPGLAPDSLRLSKRFVDYPDVTIVVPTRQSKPADAVGNGSEPPHIVQFLDSIARSDYPLERVHVLIGDDLEDDSIYTGRQWPFEWRRILTTRPAGMRFNYAAKMNQLWREAKTDCLILVNDDVTVTTPDWIQALLTFSTEADVGGVGARLLYPNGTIQHAGMPGGVYGLCTHAWIGEPAEAPTYGDWAIVHREWSMVTGAVFATRRALLEEVDGFDERFSLDFNDADLCLRLRMLGYRIVYTPHAELIHHEKGSRGTATWPPSELALFLKRWESFLANDPAFNPSLSKTTHKIQPVKLNGRWWQAENERTENLSKKSPPGTQLA